MKTTLLVGSAMLSIIFLTMYIYFMVTFSLSLDQDLAGWGVLALLVMSPSALMMLIGCIFNILYNVKQKPNQLLSAAIFYSVGCVIVYQIFYFSILQALICWFFWFQLRKELA